MSELYIMFLHYSPLYMLKSYFLYIFVKFYEPKKAYAKKFIGRAQPCKRKQPTPQMMTQQASRGWAPGGGKWGLSAARGAATRGGNGSEQLLAFLLFYSICRGG